MTRTRPPSLTRLPLAVRGCAVALVVALALAGCSSASRSGGSGGGAIEVGLIPPTTGALAQFGTDEVRAWRFAADQVNAHGGVDGHKMVVHVYDTDGSPATTITAARQAVSRDGIRFLGAVITGPENQALNAQLESMGALNFNGTANDDGLIGADCNQNAFRSVTSSSMDLDALSATVAKLPQKKWAILAEDYSIGHSAATTFSAAVRQHGGAVTQTLFAPLGTTDFGPYVAKLQKSGADGLFVVEYGSDAVAFVQQASQYHLFDRFGKVIGMNMVSEPLFSAIGKDTVGFLGNVNYDVHADNATNNAFVKAWTAKFGSAPYYVDADTYDSAQLLIAGVRAAHSTDPAKVRAALSGLTVQTLAGPLTVRAADHQLMLPSYVGVVQRSGAGYAWRILSSMPAATSSPKASAACHL